MLLLMNIIQCMEHSVGLHGLILNQEQIKETNIQRNETKLTEFGVLCRWAGTDFGLRVDGNVPEKTVSEPRILLSFTAASYIKCIKEIKCYILIN